MAWPAEQVAELLRGLEPLPEKVVRLRYGLGCERAHSATEIARAFQVSREVIAGILSGAQEQLAKLGLTPCQLRAAAHSSHTSGVDRNPGPFFRARSCRGHLP